MAGEKFRDEQDYLKPAGPPIDWAEVYAIAKRVLRGEIVRQDTGNVARTAFGFSGTAIQLARGFVTMMENMGWSKNELLQKLGPPEDRPRKAREGDFGVVRTSDGYKEASELDRGLAHQTLARGHRKPFREQRLKRPDGAP